MNIKDEAKLTEILVDWFYHVDLILDNTDLDKFHDKSVVTEQAKQIAHYIKLQLGE